MTIAEDRPLKGARVRARSRRALAWWLGELAGCRDDLRRALATQGRHRTTIEAGERYWLLRRGGHPLGQIDVQAGDVRGLLPLIPPGARRRAVVIEIPPERVLARVITLPAGAKGQLDRMLGFEIARHFPFPAERVYFRHRVIGDAGGDVVTVEIVAVPRDIVDDICRALGDAGLHPAAVAVGGGPNAPPLYLPAAALGAGHRQHNPGVRRLAAALGVAGVAALVSWPLAQRAELGALDRELAALKPRAEAMLRAGEAERRDGERSAAILALRAGRPPLVAVLDMLSRDLPDGAWLLSLSIAGRDVVLDGLAPSAATVALALEKTQDVSDIVFRSPITRESSGLEHFQLGATLRTAGGEARP